MDGGFYKRSSQEIIGKIFLSEKNLETFLTEAEAVINFRLLVYVGEDFDSGFSLTPDDFF